MVKRKYLLVFPPQVVEQPITYHLIHDYHLVINILKASVTPGKKGKLTVEVEGEEENLRQAMNYLASLKVEIRPVIEGIKWLEERCVHCTACVPGCPGQCFVVNRETMHVSFIEERCIGCKHCLSVCAYGAIILMEEENMT
ncbi:MAG TPA: 4Fe-4S dicluster domain-containing protein [Candidatus Desulfofervidus auxilii]|uniref:4Fe-4S dicluster domain-containing protein n=1 Tax=Desulfofervidus auxilii TaxID=1621989 RepID=A0A7C0Y435_DESA2|nr:4Fe-4S dicluster domain-containing protein [Candidatus Desulfofervidus auxilii]